jgi:hypothetical protein
LVALVGDRVVGCVAGWDQSGFKQTVVRGYARRLARWRPLLNLTAKLGWWPVLPPLHTPFQFRFASHLAVDADDPHVFAALLRALYNQAVQRSDHYLMIGLAAGNPFTPVVKRSYPIVSYASQIYLAAWGDGLDALAQIDARPAGLEIALL